MTIRTVEYLRTLNRLQLQKNHHNEKVAEHNCQLQKYMDARERLNNSRRRNGHSLNDKIDFHMAQMMHHQTLADKFEEEKRAFQNSEQTLEARIDFDIINGRRRPKEEPKEEPEEPQADVKQEPTEDADVKQEVAMPNVVKSEPQE